MCLYGVCIFENMSSCPGCALYFHWAAESAKWRINSEIISGLYIYFSDLCCQNYITAGFKVQRQNTLFKVAVSSDQRWQYLGV